MLARQSLLQPTGLLQRPHCRESPRRNSQAVAYQTSSLADLPPPPGYIPCLTMIVNVACRYKEAEPISLKDCAEVRKAFQIMYKCSPLTWLQMLQFDPGCDMMGSTQPQLLLLISGHMLHSSTTNHTKPSIFCSINTFIECHCHH